MHRLVLVFAVWTLTTSSALATLHVDRKWGEQFWSKIDDLPPPNGTCFVCFYEQTNFAGAEFCIGKRAKERIEANPIAAPGTIESIKFGSGCNLVVNIRVTVVPFDQRVDVISADVANTGYNLTTSKNSVEEVYVEEAGRACFLGVPASSNGFGVCYSGNVPVVEGRYRDSITEVMLFKTNAHGFDVNVYENDNYNKRDVAGVHQDVANGSSTGLEQRLTSYSKIDKMGAMATGSNRTTLTRIHSIKFVCPEKDLNFTYGSLSPVS